MTTAPIFLRPMAPDDLSFVFNSWMRSYRGSEWAKMFRRDYDRGHLTVIRRLVRDSVGLVACYERDPETILGWSVTGPGVVHYVYVKHDYRRSGIAKALLAPYLAEEGRVRYTHLLAGQQWRADSETPDGPRRVAWRFSPDRQRRPPPANWHFDAYPLLGRET